MATQAVLVEAPQEAEHEEINSVDPSARERPVAVPVDQLPPVCKWQNSHVLQIANGETKSEELERQVKAALADQMDDITAALRDGQVVEIVPSHAVLSPQMASRVFDVPLAAIFKRMKSGVLPTTVLENGHRVVTYSDMEYYMTVTLDKEREDLMDRHMAFAVKEGIVD